MIRMEIIRIEKQIAGKRLAKYQQIIKRREGKKNDSSENVRRGCETTD